LSWLSKIFGYVPTEQRQGISFAKEPCWELTLLYGTKDEKFNNAVALKESKEVRQ